jgi:two-component system, NarL family, sensor histidine kinase BarA
VIEASRDGYWEWRLADNSMFWSERFHRMLGLSVAQDSPSLEMFCDLLHEEDRPRVDRCIENLLLGSGEYTAEFRMRASNGEYRVMTMRGKLMPGASGGPERIVGMISDVTEQRGVGGAGPPPERLLRRPGKRESRDRADKR